MRRPLFLARSPYRRRRLRDAARLLPLAGLVLLILPALWSPPVLPAGGTSGAVAIAEAPAGLRRMSQDVSYFFLIWAALIAVAAAFAPGLTRPARPAGPDAARGQDGRDPDDAEDED